MKRTSGRQDAYRARTRASLIKVAQQVLGEVGIGATIDDLASRAQVSHATIYNHFGSKDAFLAEALNELWNDWVLWAYNGRPVGGDLETMLEVCRKLFRIDQSHTLFGRVLNKTFQNTTFVLDAIRPAAEQAFKDAAKKSGLESEAFDTRFDLWSYCLVGIFHGVFVSKKLSPEAADKALRVSLSIWNLSKAQANKLTSTRIDLESRPQSS